MNREAFREACARFATGITVATVIGTDGQPYGLTANSFSAVSEQPPLVSVCVNHRTVAHAHFEASEVFAINILAEEQKHLSVRFSSKGGERFTGLAWEKGKTGAPLLAQSLVQLECRITHRVAAGDHTIFVGEVVRAAWRDGRPLVYYFRDYRSIAD